MMRRLSPLRLLCACETGRKRRTGPSHAAAAVIAALFTLGLAVAVPVRAAQPEPPHPVAEEAEHETHEEEAHGTRDMIARLFNFAILAGTLVYLLRAPIAKYLADRGSQIRGDLVTAAEMKRSAAAQIEEIERKMKALPGELDALRAQGAQEMAAEERRIQAAAAAERDRLLEQARREIDQQVKVAQRELVSHAADLAVGVATERIKRNITGEDQKRLVDRYVQQLKS